MNRTSLTRAHNGPFGLCACLLALIAGFAGGMATRYIAPPVALAQSQPTVPKEIRAQSFALVDAADRTISVLSTEPARSRYGAAVRNAGPARPEMRLVLRDGEGHEVFGTVLRSDSSR